MACLLMHKYKFDVIGKKSTDSRMKGIVTAIGLVGRQNSSFLTYCARYNNDTDDIKEQKPESFVDYCARFVEKKKDPLNYTYSSYGILPSKSKIEQRFFNTARKQLQPGSIFRKSIISFASNEQMNSLGIFEPKDFYKVLDVMLPSYFKACGFKVNNVNWFANFHPVKSKGQLQPHVHLNFWEKKNGKKRGYIKQDVVNKTFKDLFLQTAKDLNKYKNEDEIMQKSIIYTKMAINNHLDIFNDYYISNILQLLPTNEMKAFLNNTSLNIFSNKKEKDNATIYGPYLSFDTINKMIDRILKYDDIKESYNKSLNIFRKNYSNNEYKNKENELKGYLFKYILTEAKKEFDKSNSEFSIKEELDVIKKSNICEKFPFGYITKSERFSVYRKHLKNNKDFLKAIKTLIENKTFELCKDLKDTNSDYSNNSIQEVNHADEEDYNIYCEDIFNDCLELYPELSQDYESFCDRVYELCDEDVANAKIEELKELIYDYIFEEIYEERIEFNDRSINRIVKFDMYYRAKYNNDYKLFYKKHGNPWSRYLNANIRRMIAEQQKEVEEAAEEGLKSIIGGYEK